VSEARRLTKRQVERLTERYDADPVAALHEAVGALSDRDGADWPDLVDGLADHPMVDHAALRRGDVAATDRLLMLLVETRELPVRRPR
jgi:hypothetical protein